MNRFVIDTNVIISAILFQNSNPAKAVSLAKKLGCILLSETIFREMQKTLSRPKFDRYLSINQRRKVLSQLIEITRTFNVCRDPKDDEFYQLLINRQILIPPTDNDDEHNELILASLRTSLQQVKEGKIHPISNLWDDIDV